MHGILAPEPGIKPRAPVVKAPSSNHWTTREFLQLSFLKQLLCDGHSCRCWPFNNEEDTGTVPRSSWKLFLSSIKLKEKSEDVKFQPREE